MMFLECQNLTWSFPPSPAMLCRLWTHLHLCLPRRRLFSSALSSRALFIRMRESSGEGDHLGAISHLIQMLRDPSLQPDRPVYLLLLKCSAALSSHRLATSVHAHIFKSGYHQDIFIATALLYMLSKCDNFVAACELFDEMPERDVAAWNVMLSAYSTNGYVDQALSLIREMSSCGVEPSSLTLSILLHLCGNVTDRRLGRCVHGYACRKFGSGDASLSNSLLVYYNQCGEVGTSERLFEIMPERDVVSWNVLIAGYTKNGCAWRALEAFHLIREEGLDLDIVTLETALQACSQVGADAIVDGELIHAHMIKLGFPLDIYAYNSLLHMYCKCGRMEASQSLFDRMKVRNLVSWNILVNGFIQTKDLKNALLTVRKARLSEAGMSSDLLVAALQAVKQMELHVENVMGFHCLALKMGCNYDMFVISSLINAYGDFGEIELAHRCLSYVIDRKDGATVCYNTLLSVYLHHGYFSEAIELLSLMHHLACKLDSITLVNSVSICTSHLDLRQGKAVHAYVLRNKFESDIFVSTSLIEFYAKCRHLRFACLLFSRMPFKNTVAWNTMIHGCVENGFPGSSLKLFLLMQWQDGLIPDATSVVGSIEAISQRGYESEGNYIHDYAVQSGFVHDEYVANALIVLHIGFHNFEKANLLLDRASKDSTIAWNTAMSEYSHHGLFGRGLSVFHLMKLKNVLPDSFTMLCLLRICAGLGSLSCVQLVHTIICKNGCESDVHVRTSLLDVYAKCGALNMAQLIFDMMDVKTKISWNSIIQAYGMHGHVEEADNLFSEMQQSGIKPSMITFLILISACSHAGDVEKGQQYMDLMTQAYSLTPAREHLSSFTDLLGRQGLIKEAYEFMEMMPVDPGISAWGALLGACRAQGNFEVGLAAAEKVFDMDPFHSGYYALLANMFMEAGRCIDSSWIRSKVKRMRLSKVHSWSMVET